jgi:hypothetical protein
VRENHLFGCARLKPSQDSVPAGLTLTSDLGICFQCQAGSSLVLRRPIEITALTGKVDFPSFGNATQDSFGQFSDATLQRAFFLAFRAISQGLSRLGVLGATGGAKVWLAME